MPVPVRPTIVMLAAFTLVGAAGCGGRTWECSRFQPDDTARLASGDFHVRYSGGIGTLDRDDIPMYVYQQSKTGVYLSGCSDDGEGMWDVDVIASAPEGAELPAAFGDPNDASDAPQLRVRLYRYREDRPAEPALFVEGPEVGVDGTLTELDLHDDRIELDATLTKPCAGECKAKQSRVQVDARLDW